jgi:oligosaccharide translocation protein RFT1
MLANNLLISLILGLIWYKIFDIPDTSSVPYYQESIIICCFSYFIEIIGEIANCILQINLIVKPRVYIEAISLLLFQFLYVILTIQYPKIGAFSYAIGRLVYSISYTTLSFHHYFKLQNKSILPTAPFTLDYEYLSLTKAYYTQSIFKQILTEGEKYMIALFNLLSFSESGVYDIINNLGSLIARFLFLPIEDASYILFKNSFKRGLTYHDQFKETADKQIELNNAKLFFEYLLKFVSFIGLFVFIYGQAYSKLALYIYGGEKLSESIVTVNMLRFYCLYVFFISVNGITESLLNSTMSDIQLNRHNFRLVLFSGLYLLFALIFVKYFHIYGFILANCFNMLLRIVYNFKYIQALFYGFTVNDDFEEDKFVKGREYRVLKNVFSRSIILNFLFCIAFTVTKISEIYVGSNLFHVLIGFIMVLVNLFFVYKFEKNFVLFIFRNLKSFGRNKSN